MVTLKKSKWGLITASLFLMFAIGLFGSLIYSTYSHSTTPNAGGILSIPWVSEAWFILLEDYADVVWLLPLLILLSAFIIYCAFGGLRIEKTAVTVRPRGSRRIPSGFTQTPTGDETFIIHYRLRNMSLMTYLFIWLIPSGLWCLFLFQGYLNGSFKTVDGTPMPFFGFLAFFLVGLGTAIHMTYLYTYKKSYQHDTDHLIIAENSFLGLRQSQLIIPKQTIKQFIQVSEQSDDSNIWHLEVETDQRVNIFSSDRYGNSEWLGQTLANWLEVEFIRANLEIQKLVPSRHTH